jgi:hypothetical protein
MAGLSQWAFFSRPESDVNFNGGLNSTSGPLSLKDTEASDLQNIDFNKFGSILKRAGYLNLNTATTSGAVASDGLWWYEYVSGGNYASNLIECTNGKVLSMTSLNGTWNDITGSASVTAGNFFTYTNWSNKVYMTNGKDAPLQWSGSSNVSTLPALQANSYTFTVNSITNAPAVGDTYTNNGVTYTLVLVNVSGSAGAIAGTIVATGSGAPTTFGTLARATGSGDVNITFTLEILNANITSARFVKQWNNYLFLANVVVGSTYYKTRIYWSNIRDDSSWSAINWIEISMQDGQEITGVYALADRLVVFKERSIFNMFFTGDATLPFVYTVSNSPTVGCVAPYSIQEVENGIVFLSYDGFYYYDGNNSYKMSLQIQNTINGLNQTRLYQARSMKQRGKNRYFCAVPSGSSPSNDTVIVWDWVLNAFSKYAGMAPSAIQTVFVSGFQEQIYFSDYSGYTYQMDTGVDDYPLKVQTAISAYYYTNWKSWGDAMLQKATPNVVIYYQSYSAILTFGYSYDFSINVDYQYTLSTATGGATYGTAVWDTSKYSSIGGLCKRQDLDGRGRVIKFYFANANMSEQFQIDGLGQFVGVETNV